MEIDRERGEKPSAVPACVVLTQIRQGNMATMWTLSRSVAPANQSKPSRSRRRDVGRVWESEPERGIKV